MKKLFVVAIAAAMVFGGASMVLAAGNDGSGIRGSSHDFSDDIHLVTTGTKPTELSWNNRQEICRVCHAPHDKGRTNYENGLLWNHKSSELTFTMYSELAGFDTLDGTVDTTVTGSSKLCMGCHDGATNIDAFDNKSGPTGGTFTIAAYASTSINQGASTGALHGNHPVSITYEWAADGELADPTVGTFDDGNTIASVLESNKVQCASCHDVHNKNTAPGSSLLRSPNTMLISKGGDGTNADASKLCLTCHTK